MRQIEELYHSARERDGGSQIAFLADACGSDEELRREVESLLAQEVRGSPLEQLPWDGVESLLPSTPKQLVPGAQLGPYRIEAPIGAGGMGEVCRARDTRLNRDVAIKVSQEEFSDRFEREARAVAALNHPHICHLYDVGPNYLVMELVEGETLAARLERGALKLDQALALAIQITGALAEAHSKGVVHRDLKPANIMLGKSGAKVLDFGLAKMAHRGVDEEQTHTVTAKGTLLGTVQYMSPEQAQGKEADARSDIFSFGLVLYEMITGKRAFEGSNPSSIIAAILEREAPVLEPEGLNRVVRACLAKDPNERWQTARDLKRELEWISIAAQPGSAVPLVLDKRLRFGSLPWVLAAVIALAAALAAFLYVRHPTTATSELVRFELSAPEDAPFWREVRISPDGRSIAFSAAGGGDIRPRLWVRPLESLEARPLAGTEGATGGLFWLADSRTLVFTAAGKLRKIDVTGGPAQAICDFNDSVSGGFLTADNRIVFAVARAGRSIQACPAGGGVATLITKFKPGGQDSWHVYPVLLPDRRHFLFWRMAGPASGIYAGSLDAKPEEQTGRRVLPDDSLPLYVSGPDGRSGRLLFVREGRMMAQGFDAGTLALTGEAIPLGADRVALMSQSASQNGTLVYLKEAESSDVQLTWFDQQGKTLGTVGGVRAAFLMMRISPDGKRLAIIRRQPGVKNSDIWVVDLVNGVETRITSDPSNNVAPVWSPDGRRIVFASERGGALNPYMRAADGAGHDELLLKTDVPTNPVAWSRDGKFLLLNVFSATGGDVWVLPMEPGPGGERKPIPYLRTDAQEFGGDFSPDGRFVAYKSDESGSPEFYVRPFDPASPEASGTGRGKVRVSMNGAGGVLWPLNGKELLYGTPDGKAWSVSVTLTPELRVGAPFQLGPFPRGMRDVTPDGQRVLVAVPVRAPKPQPAIVVLNWQAGLKK